LGHARLDFEGLRTGLEVQRNMVIGINEWNRKNDNG
jgi:hypothetical protein